MTTTNTIDLAKAALEADGYPYTTETGEGFSGPWTALLVGYAAQAGDQTGLRIWSEDTETDLHVAFVNAKGWLGDSVAINGTSLITTVLGAMIGELMDQVDGVAV